MENLLDQIGALVMGVWALAQGGFDGVNQIMGLLIALVATFLMVSWRGLWGTAAGAAIVHIAIGVLQPMLNGAAFALPPILTMGFWMTALALFLGYAIVIAVFFFIKTLLTGRAFRRGHTRHGHAH